MTSGTLYRVMTQNVTLRDIDTFRIKHHVHACFHRRLEILFPSDGKEFNRVYNGRKTKPNKITEKFASFIVHSLIFGKFRG